MEIRPVEYADLPALVDLERGATVAALPKVYRSQASFPLAKQLQARTREFGDPWITFTLAEDEQGLSGWIAYTEDQLRQLVVSERLAGSELRDELYGEALRHWRAGEVPRVWIWVPSDDLVARADFEGRGWKATGRRRAAPLPPHPTMSEYLLTLR